MAPNRPRLCDTCSMQRISVKQFGPLFHGTDTAGLKELSQQAGGGPRYPAMRKSYGWNYTTTDMNTAIQYAKDAAAQSRTHKPAVVYQVTPRRVNNLWGPDPDSGPGGFGDGPRNKREALDWHEGGSEVSLRFSSPLRALREVFVEDKAYDVTPWKHRTIS